MHIATKPEALTDLREGSTVSVHSYGNLYRARVAELKGNRARCVWTNKSGVRYDNWITIPGRELHQRNPVAAATRKLRAEATRREKYAKEHETRSRDRAVEHLNELRDIQAQVAAGTLQVRSEDSKYGTRCYFVGEKMVAWGGHLKDGALELDAALQRAIEQAVEQVENHNAAIRAGLEHAKELRAKADSIQKGAAK
jgi:hypothetical protein